MNFITKKNKVRKLQEIFLNSWPAKDYFFLNGWILRFTEGVTWRSNTVIPLNYHGTKKTLGEDIHKVEKPKIPEICGLAILIGTILTVIFLIFLNIQNKVDYISFILCGMMAGMIGFYDDLKNLGANKKAVLTAFACIPIFLLGTYHPYPILPFIGGVRLTIVYPILIPFAIAIPSNAVNMMDVFNGSMTGTCAIISFA